MIEKTIHNHLSTSLHLLTQKCKTLNQLKQIQTQFIKFDLFSNAAAIASFISSAATSTSTGFVSYTHFIFQNLRHRTTYQYNNIIRGYVQSNLPVPAILCYRDMLREGIFRNCYTFTPLVKACSMVLNEFRYMGLVVHAHVFKIGFYCDRYISSSLIEFYALNSEMGKAQKLFDEIPVRDEVLWTNMIDGYGKIGDVEKARLLFDEMPSRNVVCWSAIMAAYSRFSDFKEVLSLYERMGDAGLKPNESVLVSALTACAHLGALGQGLWIHTYAKKFNYTTNTILATALVDMYSKCGCVQLALAVFEEIHYKDSGAWNAVISGFAMNGNALKAIELFDEMVLSGIKPTEATFVSILAACTHSNLVEKGILLFESMSTIYEIEPMAEHLACFIDLLARSGKIEEAERYIVERIGRFVETDANVWGALLGACRVYGKIEIGNRVWRKLMDKGVVDYGNHVLAYNMYTEAGWVAEAKSVRELMKERQMKKNPGCSSIEVNGIVEEFFASDKAHPHIEKICEMIDSLLQDQSSVTLYEHV